MNVGSYIFQSPYPSPIQVGRPDPQAKMEEGSGNTAEASVQPAVKAQPDASAFVAQKTKPVPSVNVVASSTNSALSSSLESFSSINKQAKVVEAYTGN